MTDNITYHYSKDNVKENIMRNFAFISITRLLCLYNIEVTAAELISKDQAAKVYDDVRDIS